MDCTNNTECIHSRVCDKTDRDLCETFVYFVLNLCPISSYNKKKQTLLN